MKKKKITKKAQYGMEMIQPLGMNQLPVNPYMPQMQQVQVPQLPTFESSKAPQVPNVLSQVQGMGGGSMAGTVGSIAGTALGGPIGGAIGGAVGNTVGQVGKFLNKLTSSGLQIANALIPEQDKTRYSQALPMSYNPYPQGTGSQAIYENGGYVTKSRKKRGISVTEEVPVTPFEPTVTLQQPQEPTFATPTKPTVTYESIYNPTGDLAYFAPKFQNFNRNQAMQEMQNLPDQYGNIPVLKSPELYSDLYTNFRTEQNSNNWIPSTDYSITPMDNSNFQQYNFGGMIPEAESGIHIKPENRGLLHKNLGVPEGEKIPLSKLQIKESDSPAIKKRKQFALNARKWKHEDGGEIQQFKGGGKVAPYVTHDPKDPRIQAYSDSLTLHNSTKGNLRALNNAITDEDAGRIVQFYNTREREPKFIEAAQRLKNYNKSDVVPKYTEKDIPEGGLSWAKEYAKPRQSVEYIPNISIESIPMNNSYTMPISFEIPLPEGKKVPRFGPRTFRSDYMNNPGGYREVFRKGGEIEPYMTHNPRDPRIQAYNDSLTLYNVTKGMINDLDKTSNISDWMNYTDSWYKTNDKKVTPAYDRLTKFNKEEPRPSKIKKKFNENNGAVEYARPVQPVIYRSNPNIESIPMSGMSELPVDTNIVSPEYKNIPHLGPRSYRMDYMQGLKRVYEDGGRVGNKATEADSLAVYNNTKQVLQYYKDDGFIEGNEYDLSMVQIKDLISKGFEIEF